MNFTAAETEACARLVTMALEEDLGSAGDVTSLALIPPMLERRAAFVARSAGVVAGLPAAALVFRAVDPQVEFRPLFKDGAAVQPGNRLAEVRGLARSLLAAERSALNFLQHLSGVATLTRRYVDAVAGLRCRILDTRKTLPGWRLLEKYAVRCGGGDNHRMGLYDGILIKDNHLAAVRREGVGGGEHTPGRPFPSGRLRNPARLPVEVEVDTLEQLDDAFECRPDFVLLDNMSPEDMREAVRRRDAVAPGVLLEASGGIDLVNVRAVAETGVDRISVGALTHSAPALDIGLDAVES